MLDLQSGQRLHLVLGSPAKEALGSYLADGGTRGLWNAGPYRKHDLLLTVLDSRPRTLLCLERAGSDSGPDSLDIEVAEAYTFTQLIFVPAVQERLQAKLPPVPGPGPGPVPEAIATALLDAIAAEVLEPTPVEAKEGEHCQATSRKRSSGLQVAALQASGGVCSGCERDLGSMFGGQGLTALEVHHLDPLSQSTQVVQTTPDRLTVVCGACHNLLHSKRNPSLQEVRYEWRPSCPSCRARRARRIQWGLPAGQPEFDDIVQGGCALPDRIPEWQCGVCRHEWGGADWPGEDRAREQLMFATGVLTQMLDYSSPYSPDAKLTALNAPAGIALNALGRALGDGNDLTGTRVVAVPGEDADWLEIWPFALTYDGYGRHGGLDGVAQIAKEALTAWREAGETPYLLAQARCALFFEQRGWRHLDEEPDEEALRYIHMLIRRIAELSGGVVLAEAPAL